MLQWPVAAEQWLEQVTAPRFIGTLSCCEAAQGEGGEGYLGSAVGGEGRVPAGRVVDASAT